ncbi:MAG: hypothetical protein ACR2H0_09045 [Candidatus Limnocylindrales bacterium]
MDDPATGWGTLDTDISSISYEGGALRIGIKTETGAAYSERPVLVEYGVLLVAAQMTPTGSGVMGLLCSATDDTYYGGGLTTDGGVIFFTIEGGEVDVLHRDDDAGLEIGDSVGLGLECGGISTGALRLVLVQQGGGVIDIYQNDEGPEAFDGVGVYAEAFELGFAL